MVFKIPTEGVFDSPNLRVCINRQWLPHMLGLDQLGDVDHWVSYGQSYVDAVDLAQQGNELLAKFAETPADDCVVDPTGDCTGAGACNFTDTSTPFGMLQLYSIGVSFPTVITYGAVVPGEGIASTETTEGGQTYQRLAVTVFLPVRVVPTEVVVTFDWSAQLYLSPSLPNGNFCQLRVAQGIGSGVAIANSQCFPTQNNPYFGLAFRQPVGPGFYQNFGVSGTEVEIYLEGGNATSVGGFPPGFKGALLRSVSIAGYEVV